MARWHVCGEGFRWYSGGVHDTSANGTVRVLQRDAVSIGTALMAFFWRNAIVFICGKSAATITTFMHDTRQSKTHEPSSSPSSQPLPLRPSLPVSSLESR